MGVDDTYSTGTGISNKKWVELDAEYNLLLEIKHPKNEIWDNVDKDTVDVRESGASFDDDEEEDDDGGEYYEFDSNNKRRHINRSDTMKNIY